MASEMKEETSSSSSAFSEGSSCISNIPPDRLEKYEKMRCLEFISATRQCLCQFCNI